MRRLIIVLLLLLVGSVGYAEELNIGMKAPDWSFEDADGKIFSMDSWAGKVLLVNYVDPDESDLNEHFTDAMKKAKDDGPMLKLERISPKEEVDDVLQVTAERMYGCVVHDYPLVWLWCGR